MLRLGCQTVGVAFALGVGIFVVEVESVPAVVDTTVDSVTLTSHDGTVSLSVEPTGISSVSALGTVFSLSPLESGSGSGTFLDLPGATNNSTLTVDSHGNAVIQTVVADSTTGQGLMIDQVFAQTENSVHCTATVHSFKSGSGQPWTAPIVTSLSMADASNLQLWAPWDRESAQHGQTDWVDPLVPSDGEKGWWTGQYYYGKFGVDDVIVAPMVSVLNPTADAGVSLLLDPLDDQVELVVCPTVVILLRVWLFKAAFRCVVFLCFQPHYVFWCSLCQHLSNIVVLLSSKLLVTTVRRGLCISPAPCFDLIRWLPQRGVIRQRSMFLRWISSPTKLAFGLPYLRRWHVGHRFVCKCTQSNCNFVLMFGLVTIAMLCMSLIVNQLWKPAEPAAIGEIEGLGSYR